MKKIKEKKTGSIKFKLIVIPLILVFIAIFVIGITTSYLLKESLIQAKEIAGFELVDQVVERIADNSNAILNINEVLEEDMIAAAQAAIRHQDELTNEILYQIIEDSTVDALYWYNSDREIIYSTVPGDIGWIVPEDHPLTTFKNSSESQMIEDIRQDAASAKGDYFKFGAIKGNNGEFVQVAILANRVKDLTDQYGYQNLVHNLVQTENIIYAGFSDPSALVIANSDETRIGQGVTVEKSITAIENEERSSFIHEDNNGNQVYEVLVPVNINGEYIGSLNVGFSMVETNKAINRNIFIIFLIGILSFIILGIILTIISRTIVKNLNFAKEHLNIMALGDFTQPISPKLLNLKDEFGEISNSIDNLQGFVRNTTMNMSNASEQLKLSSEKLKTASQESTLVSEEIAHTVEEISIGANDQAHDTEKGAERINELGDLIERNQDYIEVLNLSTKEVNLLKNEGSERIKELVESTKLNQSSIEEINSIIINTNESAERIEAASHMIEGIAEQTNLLALNAAIEAARAGESGRGFSVVADEVRKLAEMSTKFTEEIVTIIKDLTSKTENAVNNIKKVGESTEDQVRSVEITNEKFEGIALALEKIIEAIGNVNHSGEEMREKKEEIIEIIENLSAISEENAAGTEETSASVEEQLSSMLEIEHASQSLLELAENMYESISKLKY